MSSSLSNLEFADSQFYPHIIPYYLLYIETTAVKVNYSPLQLQSFSYFYVFCLQRNLTQKCQEMMRANLERTQELKDIFL